MIIFFTYGVLFSAFSFDQVVCVPFKYTFMSISRSSEIKEKKRRDVREGVWRVSAVGLCDWRFLGRRRRQGLSTVSQLPLSFVCTWQVSVLSCL